MYNKNYYPTPTYIINSMLRPIEGTIRRSTILEPSAGMGAICDALRFRGASTSSIFTCEIEPEMQATLKGKGYKVLNGDFLELSGAMQFDLIVMNPPFDRGDAHLLKAWEIMRNGKIICLLNEETIKNPHTAARRELADIIQKHGTVEYLGPAFESAARKTSVGVALVRLEKKSEQSGTEFNLNSSAKVQDIELNSDTGEMERANYVDALVRSYEKGIETTAALYRAMKDFQLYTSVFTSSSEARKMVAAFFEAAQDSGYVAAHNGFAMQFQRLAWNAIFDKTRVSGLMTTKVREKFDTWRQEAGGTDLNRENIVLLFEALMQQKGQIGDEIIVEAFDKLTLYSPKNRQNFKESWKTNSAYMVSDKFILGYVVDSSWGYLRLTHGRHGADLLNDVDRALCILSGKNFEDVNQTARAISAWCDNKTKPEESEFFTFKCYLKGSVHFKFKDEALRAAFNRRACQAKGWQLPEAETFHGKARRK